MDLPQEHYRQQLFDTVLAAAPESLLDVGCGDGAFLIKAAARGCRGTGIEPNADRQRGLAERGIEVRPGRAEALPFADASFDAVVIEYVAHHIENLPLALREAVRVARRGVFVLDPWYDAALPSQRVAQALDRWFKVIDRRTGMVHNDCLEVADFLRPLAANAGLSFDYAQRLVLMPYPLAEIEAESREHLAKIPADAALQHRLEEILDDARRDGISRDGALFVAIRKG